MKHKNLKQAGFTLLELSIVILIMGLAFTGLIMFGKIKLAKDIEQNTHDSMELIVTGVNSYKQVLEDQYAGERAGDATFTDSAVYPCPARMDLSFDSPGYGVAVDCNDVLILPALGTCANGICRVAGIGGREVIIGAVPFADIYGDILTGVLDEEEIMTISDYRGLEFQNDGWGRQYTYFVTRRMTDETIVDDAQTGAVNVVDETGVSMLENFGGVAYGAHFAIVSHGEDGSGAYDSGVQVRACNAAATVDVENCDHLLGAGLADATIINGVRRRGNAAATYFDDVVYYSVKYTDLLWDMKYAKTTAIPGPPDEIFHFSLNREYIGINTETPTDKLVIGADAAAGKASIMAATETHTNEYCFDDLGVRKCFEPSLISTPAKNCAGEQVMDGILNNDKRCANVSFEDPAAMPAGNRCPPVGGVKQFVSEIDLDWGLTCE